MKQKRQEQLEMLGHNDPHNWSLLDRKSELPSHSGRGKTGGTDREPPYRKGKRGSHRPSWV